MSIETDPRVIRFGVWRGEEYDSGFPSESGFRQSDQLTTDSCPLVVLVDGQIGQIATKREVRDRPCDAHELLIVPRGAQQIRVLKHRSDTLRIVHGPPVTQRATPQQCYELIRCYAAFRFITDSHA